MANPRKFSEKIALHNKKQAEETAAFEAVLREVSATTQVCLTLSISSQCGGSLTVAVERMFAFRLLLGSRHSMIHGSMVRWRSPGRCGRNSSDDVFQKSLLTLRKCQSDCCFSETSLSSLKTGPARPELVSLKPDRKTEHKTAEINSDGRASPMTAWPHTTSSADQTVALLATVACACVSAQ